MNSGLSKKLIAKKKSSALLLFFFILAFVNMLFAATFEAYTDKTLKFKVFQQGGSIWMATNGGVIRWDMATNRSTEFTTAEGILSNIISRGIGDSTGNVWFSSYGGLNRFDGQKWQTYKNLPGGTVDFYRPSKVLLSNDAGKILYTYLQYDSTVFACFNGTFQLPDNSVSGAFVWTDGEKRRWEWLRQSAKRSYSDTPIFDVASATDTISDTLPDSYNYFLEQLHVDVNGRLWIPVGQLTGLLGYSMFDGYKWQHFFGIKGGLKTVTINVTEPAQPIDTGVGKFSYRFLRIDGTIDTINCNKWDEFSRVKDSLCIPPSMTIDTAGRLWIGTMTGLICCDDNGATEFNFQNGPMGMVSSIVEDTKENLWFCGSRGLAIFDGQSWIYPDKLNEKIASLVTVKTVPSSSDAGGMWLMSGVSFNDESNTTKTGKGIAYYNGKSWNDVIVYTKENGLASDIVLELAVDDDNTVWCACLGDTARLCKFKDNIWTTIAYPVGLGGEVQKIHIDKKGDIWIIASNVARYNGSEWQVFPMILYGGKTTNNYVFESSTGVMWFMTEYKGLCRYDGTEWTTNFFDSAPINTTIRAITEDFDRRLWVGLYCAPAIEGLQNCTQGVWRQKEVGSKEFSLVKETGSGFALTIFCDVNGGIWFSNSEGDQHIYWYDGSQWKTYSCEDGLAGGWITSILTAKNGDIWFAGNDDVSRLRSGGIAVQHVQCAPFKRLGRGLVSKKLLTSEHHTGISASATLYDILGRHVDPQRCLTTGIQKAKGIYITVLPKVKKIGDYDQSASVIESDR